MLVAGEEGGAILKHLAEGGGRGAILKHVEEGEGGVVGWVEIQRTMK